MRRALASCLVILLTALAAACTTSPLGRSQLAFVPEPQMTQMGVEAFQQIRDETPVSKEARANAYVRCVADAITSELTGPGAKTAWEVVVFDDDQVNAFALPGGKIGVYEGLLGVAENQHQLATVMGHEVAHVLAHHANERVSTAMAAEGAMRAVEVLAGGPSPGQRRLMAALGLGAQVGIILPFGRDQESEADLLGLDLMAKAGFDPRESVDLWQNMSAAGGEAPPEFLSTHPAHQTRIQNLQQRMPRALELRAEAGGTPSCAP